MKKRKPSYRELEKRLAMTEPIVEALKRNEVDAVVGAEKIAYLLVQGVQEELVNCETNFGVLFNLAGIGMAVAVTPSFRFTRVNSKLCELLGYTAEELLTMTYVGLTDPRDRKSDLLSLAEVIRGAQDSWTIEKRCLRKDGRVIKVGVYGAAVRDETGRAVRMMVMIGPSAARQRTAVKPATK